MKLILCPNCADVRKLELRKETRCSCGRSWGQYLNEQMAEVGGIAVTLGMSNFSLREQLLRKGGPQPGAKIQCWVYDEQGPRSHVIRRK